MTVRVIEGDCRTVLPMIGHADVVITDPIWPNCPPGMFAMTDRPEHLFAEALTLLPADVQRIVVVLRTDSDVRFLAAVPRRWPFFDCYWLPYVLPRYSGRKLGGNEIAYAFGAPVTWRPDCRVIPNIAPKAQSTEKNGHPCPRALAHMAFLVKWWSSQGETILDPFAGSGTIGLAAKHLGRDAVLIEIDSAYCEIARARLAADAPLLAFGDAKRPERTDLSAPSREVSP